MKHLLMWMGLLLSLCSSAQTIQSFDMPILRGGIGEKTLTLPVADSARSVSAATYWDRGGRLLPADQQPILMRSARPGTTLVVRLQNTLSLPASGGWIDVRVSGQLRAQGRLIVSSTVPGTPTTSTPTQPSSTTVDLTAVNNLINQKVDKVPGLSLFSGNYGDLIGRPNLFSGSYLDLANRPAIFSGAYGDLSGKPVLSMVALSGQYSDLVGKPTMFSGSYLDLTNRPVIPVVPGWIPSADPGYLTPSAGDLRYRAAGAIDYSSLTGKPALFSGTYADLTGKPTLFSGAYADLTGKPAIPVVPGWISSTDPGYLTPSAGDLRYRAAGAIDYTSLTGKPTLFSGAWSDLTGKPVLFSGSYLDLTNRPALFSGAYADLTGKPTIPVVPGWIPSTDPGYLTPSAGDLRYRAAGAIDYSSLTGKPALFSGSYTDLTSKPALFSGAYIDLTGKPALFSGAYTDLTGKPTLSVVAGTGSYADLLNKPTLFSGSYLDLTNRPSLFSGAYADLTGKPTTFTPSSHSHVAADIVTDAARRFVTDAQIAGWNSNTGSGFSGNYNDLINKPALFSGTYSDLSGKPALFSGSYLDLTNRPTLFSGAYTDLTGKPTLSTVAGTGNYTDLLNKPTLFSGSYLDLTSKPVLFSGAYADLTGKPTLSTVAGTGNYTDLLNKPTLFSGAYADLTGKPVLFSGAYADLTGKPTSFTPTAHQHDAGDITSGTILPARLGTGSASGGKYLDGSGAWKDLNGAVSIDQWFDATLTGSPSDSTNGLGIDLNAELARIRAQFINNLTTTTPGGALDARLGKVISDSLAAQRQRIAQNAAAILGKQAQITASVSFTGNSGTFAEIHFIGNTPAETGAFAFLPITGLGVRLLSWIATTDGTFYNQGNGKMKADGTLALQGSSVSVQGSNSSSPIATFNNASGTTQVSVSQAGQVALNSIKFGDGTTMSTVPTGSTTVTTTKPSSVSAIVSAVNSATAFATVHIQAGRYDFTGTTLVLGGKKNVTLRADKDVELYNTNGGTILFSNGNNTNITIDGITFSTSFTQTAGTADLNSSLFQTNEQGTNDGVEVKNCTFRAPWCRMNLITTSAYSSTASGGNGQGNLQKNLSYHDNEFGPGGRMGLELTSHTNEDGKFSTIFMRNVKITNNYFHDLGLLARPDGVFNGMGPSVSGPVEMVDIDGNRLIDCRLLGIETAGAKRVNIINNIVDYVNQPFTGISVSDNTTRFDARDINIVGNHIRSSIKGINLYRVAEVNASNNTVKVDQDTGDGGTVYIQECLGITLTGGSVSGRANNTIRIDNSNQVQIGGGIRLKNDRVNFSLVSIFGSDAAPSTWINVNTDVFFVKSGNTPATSGVVETIGTTSNITGVR